jgi:hypothetical protein
MARKRTIERRPKGHKNYFMVDANVLAYVALPRPSKRSKVYISDAKERERAERCIEWWETIKKQLDRGVARVYVPDICIAEAFKVLAKWYYRKKFFQDAVSYNQATKRLRDFVSVPHKKMARADRKITIHDVATNRDIIIGVDRFYETLFKNKNDVQIADLILLASCKYLIEFYDIPREHLFILTCDRALVKLARKLPDLPNLIDPAEKRYSVGNTFV